MLNGIDVYEGNSINSWQQVKASGIDVVIQKATQGTGHVDSLLYYRIEKIKQAGLYIGYYHFANFNSTNPIGEAQHFLQTIKGQSLDTCLWVDVEIDDKWNKQTAINYTNQFVSYVQSQGYKIGLYTGESFYKSYLKGNIPNIPLWIANYGRQPATYPAHSWQYSETGRVNGINGYSDMDYFCDNILLSNYSVSSISSSTLSTLQKASQYVGNRTKELQEKLTKLGYNCGGTDGIFGQKTLQALCDFQGQHGLSPDGMAGNATFEKLDDLIAEKDKPTYKQPNNFCKNSVAPILPYPFISTTNISFKSAPDNNAPTNATRGVGFQVYCYGKDGDFFSVNKNGTQFLPIASLKGTKSCDIQKVLRITASEVNCYENPDKNSTINGKLPYGKTVVVYYVDKARNFALVNGRLAGLQWICLDDGVEQLYPNVFTDSINDNSKPILTNFEVVNQTNIKNMPHDWADTIETLNVGTKVDIFAKVGEWYQINNDENNPKFIKIADLKADSPLKIIKQVIVITYEGAYLYENLTSKDKNNGHLPQGKILNVWLIINGWMLVNANNETLQWIRTVDVEDYVQK